MHRVSKMATVFVLLTKTTNFVRIGSRKEPQTPITLQNLATFILVA